MKLILGDCNTKMKEIQENSIDSIVTDPPYGLNFMNCKWDVKVPGIDVWIECLRVLKPGGHLLCFAGTRTHHRMCCNIEDAGFEIRDLIAWIYGEGLPKSLDVSKSLDSHAKKTWLNISKALDKTGVDDIIKAWKTMSKNANNASETYTLIGGKGGKVIRGESSVQKNVQIVVSNEENQKSTLIESNNVSSVELTLKKKQTEIGTNTQKNDSVQENVVPHANQKKSSAVVYIVDTNFTEVNPMSKQEYSVVENVELNTPHSKRIVSFVVKKLLNRKAVSNSRRIYIVEIDVLGWLKESTVATIKVEEALKIFYGNPKSLNAEAIAVLCAELIEDLKPIILSQSKTFQNLDTKLKTDCASAINVTITESMMAHLITNTAGILKSETADKVAGTERKVIGKRIDIRSGKPKSWKQVRKGSGKALGEGWDRPNLRDREHCEDMTNLTAPATEAAKQWEGWGTGLKPAIEMISLARKPLSESTIAANVLKWGTGAINIDACRVEASRLDIEDQRAKDGSQVGKKIKNNVYGKGFVRTSAGNDKGRFPANVILDGSQMVLDLFPETKSGGNNPNNKPFSDPGIFGNIHRGSSSLNRSKGSAARFFYCAKSSKGERGNVDAYEMPLFDKTLPEVLNDHPTVKPIALMRYLCRLITPPDGVILDPFMGTGTTGIAAKEEGFDFVGIERDQHYFEIATQRLYNFL